MFLLDMIFQIIEAQYLTTLSHQKRTRYKKSFQDAIKFDKLYKQAEDQVDRLKEHYSAFYSELAYVSTVKLSSLYKAGHLFLPEAKRLEKSVEQLLSINNDSVKALELQIHYRKELLEDDSVRIRQ